MKDGGVNDRAIGITDTGVIYGNVIKGFDGVWTPVYWAPEVGKPDRYRMTALPFYNDGGDPKMFGGTLIASNKAGQAVGWINGSVIGQWGGFWNNDAAHIVAPLAPLPGAYHAIAIGINDVGQAVGYSSTPALFADHAVLWQNDATHSVVDLGVLPGDTASSAQFINNAGQIAGYSGTRTFFYQNGTMADLSTLIDPSSGTWEIRSVLALNNAGQMIIGGIHNGQLVDNILLTPMQ
jgi:probable HAF family extracellular repeat protein